MHKKKTRNLFVLRCLQNCDISRFRRLKLSKNYRLIQKEPRLQGEKGLEKGAKPLFLFR